jgi:hypothetical protein
VDLIVTRGRIDNVRSNSGCDEQRSGTERHRLDACGGEQSSPDPIGIIGNRRAPWKRRLFLNDLHALERPIVVRSMNNPSISADLVRDVANRRTFAIISHPDAGKTTLTEKLLLFGGAIQLAGTVKARKSSRHATSDWMEIEKQRGISVTSSVMQFEYAGHTINLLDTPGHEDFSEDTYRVLTAVDAAVMVIDAA